MLQPARRKYRKEQKGRNKGVATRGAKVSFGEYGLKAIARGRLTARQIEAARRAMTRHIKRGGRIWIRIFPDKPISKKPAEVRMGNGKAPVAKNTRTLTGRVVSDKMDKTVTVLVERQVLHPTIGKVVSRTKKYHAHNEGNDAKVGDKVVIEECKPISKTKAWKVAKVAERARPE